MKRFVLYIIVINIFGLLLSCKDKKEPIPTDRTSDSIILVKKYDSVKQLEIKNIRSIHDSYAHEKDSVLLGINHQLYSKYLSKFNVHDSAYYYLSLAENLIKNKKHHLFINTIYKIKVTNDLNLFEHSKIELDKIDNSNSNTKTEKLYIDVFSLPYLKYADSATYNNTMNYILNNEKEFTASFDKNPLLELQLSTEIYRYLNQKSYFNTIINKSAARLNDLKPDELATHEIYYNHLFYNLLSKVTLNQKNLSKNFKTLKNKALQSSNRELAIKYHLLHARYFQNSNTQDSAYINFSEALKISQESNDLIAQSKILKMLILITGADRKTYANELVEVNDTLDKRINYINDFIFATNANINELKNEHNSIKKQNLSIMALTIILLFTIVLYYTIKQNFKNKKYVRKHRKYLDEKTQMFNYLLDIKEQIDISILTENNRTKELIRLKTIDKIDELLLLFDKRPLNTNLMQEEIKNIENASREISHVISATNYKSVDIVNIIANLKAKYESYIKFENFIDTDIIFNNVEFKTLLRITIFSDKFINKIKYKENVTCFVSIYKIDKKSMFKIWINKSINLDEDQIVFLNDRSIYYELINDSGETTLQIHIC